MKFLKKVESAKLFGMSHLADPTYYGNRTFKIYFYNQNVDESVKAIFIREKRYF